MTITAKPGAGYELSARLFDEDTSVAVMCKGAGIRTAAVYAIRGANDYGVRRALRDAADEAIRLWKLKQESV